MITYIKQNLIDVSEGIVAHGVNCQGAMGSGVAKALVTKYPKIFGSYSLLCDLPAEELLGEVVPVQINEKLYIANCFTQNFYGRNIGRRYADPKAIEKCMDNLIPLTYETKLSIYMPKIGCGLGGLSWENEVESIIGYHSKRVYGSNIYVCDL
jgi:O-acetyl-ADP-ribose deacetylase (regulator of RNase III)